MKLMIKISILIWLYSTSIFLHAQNSSITCPTLTQLGVTQFTEENINLPIPKTEDQSLCGLLSDGEYCYGAWNLSKEEYAQGWLILITLGATNDSEALLNLNQSAIFNTPSQYDPSLGCYGAIGNLEWNLYSPDSVHIKKIARMYFKRS